ncbi:hypothetical protein B0H67DRAFT_578322 [Lasiosphaeris hirsuta]|uniref:Uncharacterized protein n=1 Tax=Lasiosphaeris hirsuta TaxID=260670 RepID=A0AA40AEP9_9PEZI|nr:hypothetical protein B0H67DRAFT_578322 [Lasiosphaeris hirsuta]
MTRDEARYGIYRALIVDRAVLDRSRFLYALYYALKAVGNKAPIEEEETRRGAKEIRKWLFCDGNAEFSVGSTLLRTLLTTSKNESAFSEPFFLAADRVCRRLFNYEVMRSGMRSAVRQALKALGMGMRMGETAQGRVGWFVKDTMPGDVVAIMSGCSVPAVLRTQDDGTYIVVGHSIIPGMMQGEIEVKAKDTILLS